MLVMVFVYQIEVIVLILYLILNIDCILYIFYLVCNNWGLVVMGTLERPSPDL